MYIKILKIRLQEEFQSKDEIAVNVFLQNNHVLQLTSQLINEKQAFWSLFITFTDKKTMLQEPEMIKYPAQTAEILNADEIKILDSLKLWRSEKAKEQKLPHYMIASNNELVSIAKFRPAKKEELIEIKGFGKYKVENFGNEIIEILEQL